MWGGVYSKGAFQAEELAGASNGVGEWRRRAAGGAVEPETPGRSRGGPGRAWRWSPGLSSSASVGASPRSGPYRCPPEVRRTYPERQGAGCELGARKHRDDLGPPAYECLKSFEKFS